jgi:hypothetical protein
VVVEDRVTKGWCPVHDRIVESRDDRCPECKTPLVDLTASPRAREESRFVVEEEEPEPETVSPAPATETSLWPEIPVPQRFSRDAITIGPGVIAAIVAGAVLAAFLLGFAIPRSRGVDPSAQATPRMRNDRLVRVERSGAGVRLRLERFTQRGGRVVLRVTVPDQPGIDIGRITGILAAPVVSNGLVLEPQPLDVRTTVSGFVAEGALSPRPDLAITGVRILSLDVLGRGSGRTTLELSRVWGEQRRGPIAIERSVGFTVSDRSMRVVGLVGWPDHLEVQVRYNATVGWTYTDQFTIVPPASRPATGEVTRDVDEGAARLITYGFAECGTVPENCLPRGLERVVLEVEPQGASIQGNWSWEFA